MTNTPSSFELQRTTTDRYWATIDNGQISIYCQSLSNKAGDVLVLRCDINMIRNMLIWADNDGPVTASITGPLAHQIRKHAKELGMTPEFFIWHAVKLFTEIGLDA